MEDAPTITEQVYGNLLVELHRAAREKDKALHERIYQAANVFLELWPDDVKRWEASWARD